MEDNATISSLTLLRMDKEALLAQLRAWHLVPQSISCKRCGADMRLHQASHTPDGWQWDCINKIFHDKRKASICKHRRSFRKGTIFAQSHLSIEQILKVCLVWVNALPLRFAMVEAAISSKTAVQWASFCREVLVESMIANPEKLGGEAKTVEIGEWRFSKEKGRRGRSAEGQWVFGGYERGTGRVFLVPADFSGADTLLPILQEWIEPGTTVVSDWWKEYDCLEREGFKRLTVDRGVRFADPESRVDTNAIVSTWRAAKASMSSNGLRQERMAGNLARYMFLKRCKQLRLNPTVEFYRLAGELCARLDEAPLENGGDDDQDRDQAEPVEPEEDLAEAGFW